MAAEAASRAARQDRRSIIDTPQGAAILRIEEQRAPTSPEVAVLVDGARSTDGLIQDAAIRALGRLERRGVVTDLLPYLRSQRPEARKQILAALEIAPGYERAQDLLLKISEGR